MWVSFVFCGLLQFEEFVYRWIYYQLMQSSYHLFERNKLRGKKTNKKQVKDSLSFSPFLRVRFSQTPFLSPSYLLQPLIWLSVCRSWSLSCAPFGTELLLLSMCPMVSAIMSPTASPRMQPALAISTLLSTSDLGCSGGVPWLPAGLILCDNWCWCCWAWDTSW